MYITSLKSISPQTTYDEIFFEGAAIPYTGNKYRAIEPSYMGMINPNLLRRMGKSIRMGIGAGFPLLQEEKDIDAIIVGSSEGGLEDCIKFLNQIVSFDEGLLTPTNFVQSTPNALAGNLALMSHNTCYNITHGHKGLAFENALIDALMLFQEGKAKTILVGNVEEISEYNFNIEMLTGQFKTEEISSQDLLASNTSGTVCGEGSSMFIMKAEATDYLAQVLDVDQITNPSETEVEQMIINLLERNNLSPLDIDALVLGVNGDNRYDFWYKYIQDTIFPTQTVFVYKNLVGEYPTSSAFATYFAANLFSGKSAPKESIQRLNSNPIKHILIYNQFKGSQHGVILMSK